MSDITYTHEVNTLDIKNLQTCKKCDLPIYEGHAYELGDDRWHINCFKCSKCESSLGCNSNFLVLGNGNLICSNCSYNCKQCKKKIYDLAILTGDQAYCSNCFKCRSCKLKIEDLRYARTSKGLFCMSCHEKLIAKKKRQDAKKKMMEQIQQQRENKSRSPDIDELNILKRNSGIASELNSSSNRSSLSIKDKNLPAPPSQKNNSQGIPNRPDITARESFHSARTERSTPSLYTPQPSPLVPSSVYDHGRSNEEVQMLREEKNSHIGDTESRASTLIKDVPSSSQSHASQSGFERSSIQSPNTTNSNSHDHNTETNNNDNDISNENQLQPPAEIPQTSAVSKPHQRSPDENEQSSFSHKNLLILSPNQFHDNEFHTTSKITPAASPEIQIMNNAITNSSLNNNGDVLLAPAEEQKIRSGCPSPFAKANRQARVVETNDYVPINDMGYVLDFNDESLDVNRTPKKQQFFGEQKLSSPPPRAPLPAVPTTPSKSRSPTTDHVLNRDSIVPQGLGLEGVVYDDIDQLSKYYTKKDASDSPPDQQTYHTIGNTTPIVTNLEEPSKNGNDIGRRNTIIRTPKLSLRHRRSISSGGSVSGKLSLFKTSNSVAVKYDEQAQKRHSRHVSEGSINASSAFTTPPLPQSSYSKATSYQSTWRQNHGRSTSDTPFLTNLDLHEEGNSFQKKMLESDVKQLETQKDNLIDEIQKLGIEKMKLNETLKGIQGKIFTESKTLEGILKEIEYVEKNKRFLGATSPDVLPIADFKQNSGSEKGSSTGSNNEPLQRNSLNTQTSTTTHHNSNSSSSLVANSSAAEAPLIEEANAETHKATRLKFWRRPKINFSSNPAMQSSITGGPGNSAKPPNTQQSQGSLPKSSSYSTYGNNNSLNPNVQYNHANFNDADKKALGSLISKSRSSNFLDSFLNGNGVSEGDNTTDAPLFSSTIQRRISFENTRVPLIVSKCIAEVEARGLDAEGIYRISGGNSAIVTIENTFAGLTPAASNDSKQMSKLDDVLKGDINAVTSALKRYFRKLPDPLIPFSVYDDFIRAGSKHSAGIDLRVNEFKSIINKLPQANRDTLYLLCKHLTLVESYSNLNRMNFKNLAVVFAPTIARDRTGEKEIIDMGHRNDSTEFLISNFEPLFQDYES